MSCQLCLQQSAALPGFITRRGGRAGDPSSPRRQTTGDGSNATTKPWRSRSDSSTITWNRQNFGRPRCSSSRSCRRSRPWNKHSDGCTEQCCGRAQAAARRDSRRATGGTGAGGVRDGGEGDRRAGVNSQMLATPSAFRTACGMKGRPGRTTTSAHGSGDDGWPTTTHRPSGTCWTRPCFLVGTRRGRHNAGQTLGGLSPVEYSRAEYSWQLAHSVQLLSIALELIESRRSALI